MVVRTVVERDEKGGKKSKNPHQREINVHSTVDYIYINISPKPQPKSRLKASKILSPGHGPSKLLYMASHGLGYRRLGSASLRPEAEPLTSLNQFLCKVFDLR